MKIRVWLGIAFLGACLAIVGPVLLVGSSAELATFQSLRAGAGVEVPATATGLYSKPPKNSRSPRGDKAKKCPHYQFTNAAGVKDYVRLAIKCSSSKPLGDYPDVTVIYDPAKPSIAYVNSATTLNMLRTDRNFAVGLACAGWLLILMSAAGILKIAVNRNKAARP